MTPRSRHCPARPHGPAGIHKPLISSLFKTNHSSGDGIMPTGMGSPGGGAGARNTDLGAECVFTFISRVRTT
jgi:hypothetical protein